jgi:Tfp pilus assembly PilM family ATPase
MDIENDPRFAEPSKPDEKKAAEVPKPDSKEREANSHSTSEKKIESKAHAEADKPQKKSSLKEKREEKKTKSSEQGSYFLFEITESKAKAIYVEYKGKNIDVQDVYLFPDESQRNSQAEMNWSEFSAWIKEITEEKVKANKVNVKVMLVGHGAYIGVLKRSQIGKVSEMRDKIAWQVAESVPFAIDSSLISYELNRESVTVGAVDPEFLEKVLSSFHEIKIYPLNVSLLPFSFQAIIKRHPILKEKTFLLVHIARHHTYLLHFYHGNFHSFRELSIGGEHVTQAMIGTLMLDDQSINIGYEEALVLKENVGIPTKNLEVNPQEPKNSQLSMRIRPIFDRLVSDITNSIKQFKVVVPGAELYRIVLTGGGAQMKGLEEFMTARLYHPTEIFEVEKTSSNVRISEVHFFRNAFFSFK